MFKTLKNIFTKKSKQPAEHPIQVICTDDQFTAQDKSATESAAIKWTDVGKVVVRTTSKGPCVDDVFYEVTYRQGVITIPSESRGVEDFIEYLYKKLPAFELKGMNSTGDASFECFVRTTPSVDNSEKI